MTRLIEQHYERLAGSYDDFLAYSSAFVPRLVAKMVEMLRLQTTDLLVDLGCGSGLYTSEILRQVRLKKPIIGVDPCRELLDRIPADTSVLRREFDALRFSQEPGSYDKVLVKETVHHVDDKLALFRNLFARLTSGGALLLVHVPPKLDYPLFKKALERCQVWHADPDELVALLKAAGFRVERDAVDYAHAIPKERYFAMVAGRYMSVLSSFENDEIDEGLAEMRATYADERVLRFNDHFDYIAGVKA